MTNEDLRQEFKKESGIEVLNQSVYLAYIDWLEKRVIINEDLFKI